MTREKRLEKFILATCQNYIREKPDGWVIDPNGIAWYDPYAGGIKSSDEAIDELLNLYFARDGYAEYDKKKKSKEEASRLRLEAEVKMLEAEVLELKAELALNKQGKSNG